MAMSLQKCLVAIFMVVDVCIATDQQPLVPSFSSEAEMLENIHSMDIKAVLVLSCKLSQCILIDRHNLRGPNVRTVSTWSPRQPTSSRLVVLG